MPKRGKKIAQPRSLGWSFPDPPKPPKEPVKLPDGKCFPKPPSGKDPLRDFIKDVLTR